MDNKQILISLSREFGTYGHKIAQNIADELGISYYDRNILDQIYNDPNLAESMKKYDEKHVHPMLNRHVRGYSNSTEENLAIMQFEFIREKAESGESFIVVGRCGETILRDFPNHMSFFILGDMYDKVQRIRERLELSEKDAINKLIRHDRNRKKYHNTYSDIKWGDSRGYDMCINDTDLGIEGTTDVIMRYISLRREMM